MASGVAEAVVALGSGEVDIAGSGAYVVSAVDVGFGAAELRVGEGAGLEVGEAANPTQAASRVMTSVRAISITTVRCMSSPLV